MLIYEKLASKVQKEIEIKHVVNLKEEIKLEKEIYTNF